MQKAIMPINKSKLTASYKNLNYESKFKFVHYGIDLVATNGSTTVYSIGEGEVISKGTDSVFGNFVVLLINQAYNHKTKVVSNLVVRMWHLASIATDIEKGTKVTRDTEIGKYGSTGQYVNGAHLHIEVDTDNKNPMHTPSLSGNSSKFFGRSSNANDKTMSNPLDWLHLKVDNPDNQTYTTVNDIYINTQDKVSPPSVTSADFSSSTKDPENRGGIVEGIDISSNNGKVDFTKVKAAGKKFVFIRLGHIGYNGEIESNKLLDTRFHENMKAAIAAGLDIGVYIYTYARTPAAATIGAKETIKLLEQYREYITYPVAFDIEDTKSTRYDQMSKSLNNSIVDAFLEEIESAGYLPMLYTYSSFAQQYLDMSTLHWDFWVAHYSEKLTYPGEWEMWQYRGDPQETKNGIYAGGTCSGVTGYVDLNTSKIDYANLKVVEPEPPEPSPLPTPLTLEERVAMLESKVAELLIWKESMK